MFECFMYYNLDAIILSRENLRDDDLLITVYSKQKGKITLQAKGAKKIKSKLAGHLEPVTLSYLNATVGKRIDQLIGAYNIDGYPKIKSSLKSIGYAAYFLELIDGLTKENHPDPRIFNLIKKYLDYLKVSNNYILIRISAGFKLLHLLGVSPSHKPKIKLPEEIDYIIKQSLEEIE